MSYGRFSPCSCYPICHLISSTTGLVSSDAVDLRAGRRGRNDGDTEGEMIVPAGLSGEKVAFQ